MRETILRFCRELNSEIPDDADVMLIDNGYLDSFGVFEVIVNLELEYGIEVRDEEFTYDNFKSIRAMMQFLQGKLARPGM